MTSGETAYLALVIGSMTVFALTLAWALYVHSPSANSAASVPASALPAH